MVKAQRGAVLPVDAGNALFAEYFSEGPQGKEKAELIFEAMGAMGVKVMGVGMRDLTLGPDYVKSGAQKRGITPLSANLTRNGKLLFAPSKVLEAGGVKIGFIGVSPPNPFGKFKGVEGQPLAPAVLKEAKKLAGKVDLIAVIAAVPLPDAMQLASEVGGAVQLLLQSHDMRGVGPGVPVQGKDNFLIHTGERGRQVALVDLELGSPTGPLVDAGVAAREEQSLRLLDAQIAETERRIAQAPTENAKQAYEGALKGFKERRAKVERSISEAKPAGARSVQVGYTTLAIELPADPALEAKVARFGVPDH